ncbi:MAG: hypothetical protein PUG95_07210, partial [Firmicutes bacterium]|nr:hypothetical protein [Bacillota bacterium]
PLCAAGPPAPACFPAAAAGRLGCQQKKKNTAGIPHFSGCRPFFIFIIYFHSSWRAGRIQ